MNHAGMHAGDEMFVKADAVRAAVARVSMYEAGKSPKARSSSHMPGSQDLGLLIKSETWLGNSTMTEPAVTRLPPAEHYARASDVLSWLGHSADQKQKHDTAGPKLVAASSRSASRASTQGRKLLLPEGSGTGHVHKSEELLHQACQQEVTPVQTLRLQSPFVSQRQPIHDVHSLPTAQGAEHLPTDASSQAPFSRKPELSEIPHNNNNNNNNSNNNKNNNNSNQPLGRPSAATRFAESPCQPGGLAVQLGAAGRNCFLSLSPPWSATHNRDGLQPSWLPQSSQAPAAQAQLGHSRLVWDGRQCSLAGQRARSYSVPQRSVDRTTNQMSRQSDDLFTVAQGSEQVCAPPALPLRQAWLHASCVEHVGAQHAGYSAADIGAAPLSLLSGSPSTTTTAATTITTPTTPPTIITTTNSNNNNNNPYAYYALPPDTSGQVSCLALASQSPKPARQSTTSETFGNALPCNEIQAGEQKPGTNFLFAPAGDTSLLNACPSLRSSHGMADEDSIHHARAYRQLCLAGHDEEPADSLKQQSCQDELACDVRAIGALRTTQDEADKTNSRTAFIGTCRQSPTAEGTAEHENSGLAGVPTGEAEQGSDDVVCWRQLHDQLESLQQTVQGIAEKHSTAVPTFNSLSDVSFRDAGPEHYFGIAPPALVLSAGYGAWICRKVGWVGDGSGDSLTPGSKAAMQLAAGSPSRFYQKTTADEVASCDPQTELLAAQSASSAPAGTSPASACSGTAKGTAEPVRNFRLAASLPSAKELRTMGMPFARNSASRTDAMSRLRRALSPQRIKKRCLAADAHLSHGASSEANCETENFPERIAAQAQACSRHAAT
ncbi:unnamed protein product [Polarella glacialis]|uniref:Uncharacterized protein n=1 Tax=Polarella glacialis TaxID=89957 RepID=A0A813JBS8_POLGL|nr:unnamed protein product [Polarella glacialis]